MADNALPPLPGDSSNPSSGPVPGVTVEEKVVTETRTVSNAIPEGAVVVAAEPQPVPPVETPVAPKPDIIIQTQVAPAPPPPPAFAKPFTVTSTTTQVSKPEGMSTMTKVLLGMVTIAALIAVSLAAYTVYTAYYAPVYTMPTPTPTPTPTSTTPTTVTTDIATIYQNDSVGYQIGLVDGYEAVDWQTVMPGQIREEANNLTRDVALLSEGRSDGGYTILISYRTDYSTEEEFLAAMEANEFSPPKYYDCFEITENTNLNQVQGVLRGEGAYPCNAETTQKFFVKNFFWLESKQMGVSMWVYYADAQALDRSIVDKMVDSFRML